MQMPVSVSEKFWIFEGLSKEIHEEISKRFSITISDEISIVKTDKNP